MGSSPEVLIAHLLAKTTRIRVGSGGVMLQHYSPYKVAENFNVLASLAPGRVDLGVGRGPGGTPQSTRALQTADGTPKPFEEKIVELAQFLENRLDENHPLHGLLVMPAASQPADLFFLGTGTNSAISAANLGLPYIFALFLNNDEQVMAEAVEAYQNQFDTTKGNRAQTILALHVIAAESDEEARQQAAQFRWCDYRWKADRSSPAVRAKPRKNSAGYPGNPTKSVSNKPTWFMALPKRYTKN